MADEPFIDLPRDIRSWFGVGKEGRVEVSNPSSVSHRWAHPAALISLTCLFRTNELLTSAPLSIHSEGLLQTSPTPFLGENAF